MVVAGLSHRRIFLFERHRVGCRGRRYHRCSEPEALARGDDRRRQRVLRRGVLRRCKRRGEFGEGALRAVAELAAAFAPSKERHLETTAQGRAFLEATRAAWPTPPLDCLLANSNRGVAPPVAVGVASAGHGIALAPALRAYLQAFAANLVSAGVRLIPLGQTDGQRVLAALEHVVAASAARASGTALDEVGGAAFRADIAGMRHESQHTRLFRS